jgi:trimethylguanosine synthase
MTVIVNRCDLWDSAAHFQPDESQHLQYHHPDVWVATYLFAPDVMSSERPKPPDFHSVAVARVPHTFQKLNLPATNAPTTEGGDHPCNVIDTKIPNPHDASVVHDKYWAQRRRLFSRFDRGIRLDSEGWYSVTPEIIADHVAHRVANLAATSPAFQNNNGQGIVILDAFCGCGGNSIAFGKIPSHLISKVVCVDTDRSKLLKAAHNASLYDIPKDKLIFVECNSAFILQYCYKNGDFVLDQPATTMPHYMPKPVMSKTFAGYQVGGLDMLPRHIDAIFMDPPWGGVDYEVLGKNGYDLQKNMKIQVGPAADEYQGDGDGVGDDFFDSFTSSQPAAAKSQRARKANFNKKKEGDFIDGMELLRVATEATSSRVVVYDLPRNTNKSSLGKCALGAGYRGNVKLEEHYLNGRLKTVTAYMGACYSTMINSLHEADAAADNKTDDDAQA